MMKRREDSKLGNLWPEEYKCAVVLSFDFDAESDELRTAPGKVVPLTKGRYGAMLGLERIFRTLEASSLPATFFVPGWVAENYPDRTKEIERRGFEIGGHGYLHEKVSELEPRNEKRVLEKSISGIRKVTGRNPVGYRAPWFDFSKHSLRLLSELGYEYDSSLMNQDLPFFVKPPVSKGKPLVELPVDWCLDDYPAFELHRKSPREVREIWQAEFDALYSEGSLLVLTMHPECIGRASRIAMLQEFIQYIQAKGRVWFASAGEVSKWWRSSHAKDRPVEVGFRTSLKGVL
jgi:peptidoglycan/xylan/chitin deacetylase (PgdA/CDA1 family)